MEEPPLDYNIDLYCYYKALQNRVHIKRFDVEFKKGFQVSQNGIKIFLLDLSLY